MPGDGSKRHDIGIFEISCTGLGPDTQSGPGVDSEHRDRRDRDSFVIMIA